MTSQFGVSQQALPLSYLIGSPLQSLVQAHGILSQSVMQFFSDLGLETNGDKKVSNPPLQVRLLEFTYNHPVPDPQNPGSVIDTPTRVKVPLLTMLSLPNFNITDATINFNVRAVGLKEEKTTGANSSPILHIQGVYASNNSQVVEPSTFAISLTLKKEQPTEGFTRIQNLLNDSIQANPIQTMTNNTKATKVR